MKCVLPLFAALIALACGYAAAAVIYGESEPNNSWTAANLIPGHDGTIIIQGSRVGDPSADYFRFPVIAGDTLTATVCCSGDPMLRLFDPSGTPVISDDDSGPGLMPLIIYPISSSGLWTIAVTGWPDWSFISGGSYGWDYELTLTMQTPAGAMIPEPATWALMGAGLASLALRRRRRGMATRGSNKPCI
ncbi:MAG: PEP-CTERM sorting domain-containing protein [Bryobacteraceae bacterium]